MNNEKDKEQDKDTAGEVGSGIAGGFDPNAKEDSQVTNADMKGKKVDADPEDPAQQPPAQ
jgi:hypothetical protein